MLKFRPLELSKAIDKYLLRGLSPFHSPVHGGSLNPRDLSELSGLDDLHNPSACLAKTQDLIAELFGARNSYMLINGASVGLMAAILALAIQEGTCKPLLLARNVHRSVISGVILAGFDIEWLEVQWSSELGAYTRFDIQNITDIKRYAALVVSNPSYEGFYSDLQRLDIPVIVDEAHGAHYRFSSLLPPSALECGADISVQSWHKCLGALTQCGVLHISPQSRIDSGLVAEALSLLQSSSPSYLLMESISSVAEHFSKQGEKLINSSIQLSREISFPLITNDDPLRFNFYLRKQPLEGEYLFSLFEEQGIALEKFSANSVLGLMQVATDPSHILKLNQAYLKISQNLSPNDQHAIPSQNSQPPYIAAQIYNPRKAFMERNTGLINPKLYAPCPPGIAVLVPGQEAHARN